MHVGPLYLAIDQGGHASRALVFDDCGRRVAAASAAIETLYGEAGRVEHPVDGVLGSIQRVLMEVAAQLGPRVHALAAAGLSCQRASVLAWDRRDGRALSPVLSWQDTRAQRQFAAAGLDHPQAAAVFAEITGLRPSLHFGASKLRWLQQHNPEVAAAQRRGQLVWGPLASFLLARITEQRSIRCPASIAQRTGLFDIRQGVWSAELGERFAVDLSALPMCVADAGEHGDLDVAGVRVPLRLVAGDQNLLPAALGALAPGQVAINAGTGAFVFAALAGGGAAAPGLLRSVLPGAVWPPLLAQEGTVNGAGAAFDWLRRTSAVDELPWPELDRDESLDAPLFLNSVGGFGSPLWRSGIEPVFDRPPATLGEGMRAVAESLVFLLQLNLQAMATGATPATLIELGGGLSRSVGVCTRLADVAGVPVRRCDDAELSLRGLWQMLDPQSTWHSAGAWVLPGALAGQRQQRYARWCGWLNRELATIDSAQGEIGESR